MKARMNAFGEFLAATGTTKLSKVAKARREAEKDYSRGGDYWRVLRLAIIHLLASGGIPSDLRNVLSRVPEGRRDNYTRVIDAFIAWMGTRKLSWVGVSRGGLWRHKELTIPIHADIGVAWGGRTRILRLHLSSTPMTKTQIDATVCLLHEVYADAEVGVLDVPRRVLHTPTPKRGMKKILENEADTFIDLWHSLDTSPGATGS